MSQTETENFPTKEPDTKSTATEDDSDGEELLQLSAETFAALTQFYNEQEDREKTVEQASGGGGAVEVEWKEDWQLSQFWYSKNTADTLARMVYSVIGASGTVACISAPTLYKHLKLLYPNCHAKVFEYDKRFSVYGEDFVVYDYRAPLSVPRDLRDSFDLVFADPPFLSEECLTKTAVTMKYLAKDKLVLCSGAVMADLADRLLSLKPASFQPQHENNLANEFRCYANFDFDMVEGSSTASTSAVTSSPADVSSAGDASTPVDTSSPVTVTDS